MGEVIPELMIKDSSGYENPEEDKYEQSPPSLSHKVSIASRTFDLHFKAKKRPAPSKKLCQYLMSEWKLFLFGLIALIAASLGALAVPVYIGWAIDELYTGNYQQIYDYCIQLAIIITVRFFVNKEIGGKFLCVLPRLLILVDE